MHGQGCILRLLLLSLALQVAVGCAASFEPRPLEEVNFLERSQTNSQGNIRVTAAVLSAEETAQVFGFALYKKGIQPVWLRVENQEEEPTWLLPVGLDPEYFTPLESAFLSRFAVREADYDKMDQYFLRLGMGNHVGPGGMRRKRFTGHLNIENSKHQII